MKIALYKSTAYGWETAFEVGDDKFDHYVRISEIFDIEFVPLPENEVIEAQLSAFDKQEQKAREEFQKALDSINDNRGKLRALTCTVTP